jgi:ribonuclease P protein component
MPYAYRKSERIRKNSEFVSVLKGKRLSADGLSLFYTENDRGNFRIGISVSKKFANAVRRNRLKRRIRAGIMSTLRNRTSGYDLVFVARRELYTADYAQILKAVEKLVHRAAFRSSTTEGTAP